MKKFLLVTSLLLLLLFVSTACRSDDNGNGGGATPTPVATPTPTPAPDPTPAPPEPEPPPPVDERWTPNELGPTTIRVSWWGGESRQLAMREALDIFRDRYPHITVVEEDGEWGGSAWMTSIFTEIAGQAESDVIQVNYAWVHSFGHGINVFYDLNTLGHILDLTEWTNELRDFMTTSDGQLAAVPHGMNGRVIIYNRAMMEEFGLNTFPSTWEEVIELGQRVAEGNATIDTGDNRYAFFPLGPESLDIVLLTLLYNATGRTLQYGGQLLHSETEVQDAFDILGQLIATNTIPTIHQQGTPWNHSNPVWVEGRGGAVFEWLSNPHLVDGAFLEGEHDNGLGVTALPGIGGRQATMQRPSLGHAISRNTSNPELAAYLINFLYTDEEALMAIGDQLGVPFSRTAAEIGEREGFARGLQGAAFEIVNYGQQGVMCEFFEDATLRNPRFAIIEEFRYGNIDSAEAARRFISEQQAALNMLMN